MESPISFLSQAFPADAPPDQVRDLDSFILGYVHYVLARNNGNKKKTAHQLGISRSTWPGASHSTAGGWCAANPPGCGASPIQSMSTSPTPPGSRCSSSRHRSRLARSRSTSGSGSLH